MKHGLIALVLVALLVALYFSIGIKSGLPNLFGAQGSSKQVSIEKAEYSVSVPRGYVFNKREDKTKDFGYIADYYTNSAGGTLSITLISPTEEFREIDAVKALIQNPRDAKAQATYGHSNTYDLSDTSYRYEYLQERAVLIYAGGIVYEMIGGSSSKPVIYKFTSEANPEILEDVVGSFLVK